MLPKHLGNFSLSYLPEWFFYILCLPLGTSSFKLQSRLPNPSPAPLGWYRWLSTLLPHYPLHASNHALNTQSCNDQISVLLASSVPSTVPGRQVTSSKCFISQQRLCLITLANISLKFIGKRSLLYELMINQLWE